MAGPETAEIAAAVAIGTPTPAAYKAVAKLEAKADVILRVLERRGLAVSDDERRRISECLWGTLLDEWLDRAVTATTTAEIFDPNPR